MIANESVRVNIVRLQLLKCGHFPVSLFLYDIKLNLFGLTFGDVILSSVGVLQCGEQRSVSLTRIQLINDSPVNYY